MNKCYGLYYLKSEAHMWSDVVAVSNDYKKLEVFILPTHKTIYVGSYDKINSPLVIRWTEEGKYPRFKIEEIPYVC